MLIEITKPIKPTAIKDVEMIYIIEPERDIVFKIVGNDVYYLVPIRDKEDKYTYTEHDAESLTNIVNTCLKKKERVFFEVKNKMKGYKTTVPHVNFKSMI